MMFKLKQYNDHIIIVYYYSFCLLMKHKYTFKKMCVIFVQEIIQFNETWCNIKIFQLYAKKDNSCRKVTFDKLCPLMLSTQN